MTDPIVMLDLQVTIDECVQHVTDKQCRNLPVVECEKSVAMLSLANVVNRIITLQDRAVRKLEDDIAGKDPSS